MNENEYTCNGNTLILSEDRLRFLYMSAAGSGNTFLGDEQMPLWRIWLYDEETRQLNTFPAHPAEKKYWQTPLVMGNNSISSIDATFVDESWDEQNGRLCLKYRHEHVEVSFFFEFSDSGIIWWGEFQNHGPFPIYRFETIPGWKITYDEDNSFLMPEYVMPAIEYKPVYETEYGINCAWNGFNITSPGPLTALYAIQNETFIPTHTKLKGDRQKAGKVSVVSSIVCFRNPDECLVGVKNKLTAFSGLREWTDAYISDNFGQLPKLHEKIDKNLFDKLASAVVCPVGGDMKEAAKIIKDIPGTLMIHTPGYMSPTKDSPITWDSFPNYFPPNKLHGTIEDFREMINVAHNSGHLFMPRTSFFYWTKGSDIDRQYDVEKLAMVRVDGKPRTANWCLPGYLISPSSKIVKQLLDEFYQQWRQLGADVYFTNVIAAIDPVGNGYDFHPDSPGPDLYFDQVRKMMSRYGSRMPMLSEGGACWQLPFQTGGCLNPAWNPDNPGAGYWRTPDRGVYMGYRCEVGVFLKNEYVRFYPHNTGTRLGQTSIQQLTFSLLNNVSPKLGMASADRFTKRNRRWLKILLHLGKTAFAKLYGARLLSYDYSGDGQIFAEYDTARIIANFSEHEYDCSHLLTDSSIVPNGFLFISKDKDTIAGSFSSYKEKKCPEGQIIIVENNVESRYSIMPENNMECGSPGKLSESESDLMIRFRLKMKSVPQYCNFQGAIPLVVPTEISDDSDTFEIRYNMHYGTVQFLQKYPSYLIGDVTAYDFELMPGENYDIAVCAGRNPGMTINGRVFDKSAWYYVHEQVPLDFQPDSSSEWNFDKDNSGWEAAEDRYFDVELC